MDLDHYRQLIDKEKGACIEGIARYGREGPVNGYRLNVDLIQIIREEPQHRAAVDRAAQYWSTNRSWPKVHPDVAGYLVTRFVSASDLLQSLAELRLESDAPESQVLSWLLVDYWRFAGRARWLHYMHNLGKPDV